MSEFTVVNPATEEIVATVARTSVGETHALGGRSPRPTGPGSCAASPVQWTPISRSWPALR